MSNELDRFARLIDDESFRMDILQRESETLNERDIGRMTTRFIKNVRVQRAVPRVEVTYQSSSKVVDARGEILSIEAGEVHSTPAIAGYEYPTDGFELSVPAMALRNSGDLRTPEAQLTALYSMGYGLRSVMARRLGVEPIEIQCEPQFVTEGIRLLVFDNETEGAGLAHPIYSDLELVLDDVAARLESCTCPDYCENCLLLPRTPSFLLDRGLLERQLGVVLLSYRTSR